MYLQEILAVILYIAILFFIGVASFKKNQTSEDFMLGGRAMNPWATALSAHASDMSTWLFIGYPAVIFTTGLFNSWFAIGLTFFMYLNWQFVAPKIRVATEQYDSMTFSSFFESRLRDTSGVIRIFTALISLVFYTIYISANIVGLGIVIESLFHLPYVLGITIGILVVIVYLFLGGYKTLAWIDLFQGLFLLAVILFVPCFALGKVGGIEPITHTIKQKQLSLSMFPDFSVSTILGIFVAFCGWGLGYFGQPHIATKFMGIKQVKRISYAKWIGMTWQILALGSATAIGLIAIAYFRQGIGNPEELFTTMVRNLFPPFISAFILCAALAATISTMDSQILVLATSLTEDFYKKIFRKQATSKELLTISRFFILFSATLAYVIAYFRISSIYNLVYFAWSGLGSAFGPLLILTLFSNKITKQGAWSGILIGGILSGIWPFFNRHFSFEIPSIIPSFFLSFLSIYVISLFTKQDQPKEKEGKESLVYD